MAVSFVITCPECEKKFKLKDDKSGKKIKCPFCEEPFVVPASQEAKSDAAKGDAKQMKAGAQSKAGAPKAKREVEAAAEAAAAAVFDEYAADPNPYGVKNVDLVPRCPNCTQEMGEHDIICLSCGYNTMTRQWGKTEKTVSVTHQRQIIYLLPPLGSVVFTLFAIVGLLIFYVVFPYWVAEMWASFLDSEAARMWLTLVFLFIFWMAGMFCFHKFIEKPKPDEIKIE